MRGCRPPAADCLRASAQRTLEAQNMGVDFTRPAVKQVYEVITPRYGEQNNGLVGFVLCFRAAQFFTKRTATENSVADFF